MRDKNPLKEEDISRGSCYYSKYQMLLKYQSCYLNAIHCRERWMAFTSDLFSAVHPDTSPPPEPKKKSSKRWPQPWKHHAAGLFPLLHLLCVLRAVSALVCALHDACEAYSHGRCCVPAVLHSGEYYLFESDSEGEDEMQCEEPSPLKQTACQVSL